MHAKEAGQADRLPQVQYEGAISGKQSECMRGGPFASVVWSVTSELAHELAAMFTPL